MKILTVLLLFVSQATFAAQCKFIASANGVWIVQALPATQWGLTQSLPNGLQYKLDQSRVDINNYEETLTVSTRAGAAESCTSKSLYATRGEGNYVGEYIGLRTVCGTGADAFSVSCRF
jgi:hypothetical protein